MVNSEDVSINTPKIIGVYYTLTQHWPNNRNIGTDMGEIIIGYITLAQRYAVNANVNPTIRPSATLAQRTCAVWEFASNTDQLLQRIS